MFCKEKYQRASQMVDFVTQTPYKVVICEEQQTGMEQTIGVQSVDDQPTDGQPGNQRRKNESKDQPKEQESKYDVSKKKENDKETIKNMVEMEHLMHVSVTPII